jgi:type IV pilus assembly protein PilE
MPAPVDYFAFEWLRRREMPGPVPLCRPPAVPHGFTLIELLVVLAITAVLAAIAIPTYGDHLRRGRITEALARLADQRVRMEQFYLDHRRYDDGAGGCGHPTPPGGGADAFALECVATAEGYVARATGLEARGMHGFVYTIDEADARRTPGVPDGWVGSDRCWVLRRDGSCG